MKNLIIILIIPFIFSGCSYVTKQMLEKNDQDRIKLKEAIVKLIQKNNDLVKKTNNLETQIIKLDEQIVTLKDNVKKINEKVKKNEVIKGLKEDKSTAIKLKLNNNEEFFMVKIIKHMVNMRKEPSLDSLIVGIASKGDIYKVVDKTKGFEGKNIWYKILSADKPLWIHHTTAKVIKNDDER